MSTALQNTLAATAALFVAVTLWLPTVSPAHAAPANHAQIMVSAPALA